MFLHESGQPSFSGFIALFAVSVWQEADSRFHFGTFSPMEAAGAHIRDTFLAAALARNLQTQFPMQLAPVVNDPLLGLLASPAAPQAQPDGKNGLPWLAEWDSQANPFELTATASDIHMPSGPWKEVPRLPMMGMPRIPPSPVEADLSGAIAPVATVAAECEDLSRAGGCEARVPSLPVEPDGDEERESEHTNAQVRPEAYWTQPLVVTQPLEAVSVSAPAESPAPLESVARRARSFEEPVALETQRTTTPGLTGPAPDKGEVIWDADLVLLRDARLSTPPGEPGTQDEKASIHTETPKPPMNAQDQPRDESGRSPDTNNTHQPKATKNEAGMDPKPAQEPVKTEPRPAAKLAKIESETKAPDGPSPLALAPQAKSEGLYEAPKEPVTKLEAVEALEPIRAPRSAQVTTVQVDLRQPGAERPDDPSVRLVLTQRGDQVNVQVRSWDNSVTPIPVEQMQPLLDSLASEGLTVRQAAGEYAEISNTVAVEAPSEKPLVASESSQSQNDTASPRQFDERQERRQEQHRQHQQQLYNRRQPSNRPRFELASSNGNGR